MKTKFNINEEYFTKFKRKISEYQGEKLFRIDQDNGKIYETTEMNQNKNSFYITYDEYLEISEFQKPIIEQIKLLKEKQETLLEITNMTIRKIISDRDKREKTKKFNL
jgi:hypothetical protein